MIKPITTTAILAASLISSVFASDIITLGDIRFAGNGCPTTTEVKGQTLTKLSGNTLLVTPLQFDLSIKPQGRSFVRKKCDFAIPVKVTAGYRVGITNAKLYAFVSLDERSKATTSLSIGFAGTRFQTSTNKYPTNTFNNVLLNRPMTRWSACGAGGIIRAKASATLHGVKDTEAYVRVNGLSMNVVYQAC